MSLFGNRFTKEGPGISKDAPQKKGLALFFDIFIREFWDLIKLNLLFVLFCIPIITIPPAMAGMASVLSKMVRDETSFVWSDFWKGFKENWKHSYPLGIISLFFLLSSLSSFFLGVNNVIFIAIGFLSSMVGTLFTANAFTMLVTVNLKLPDIIKNSFILCISCFNYLLPAYIVIAVITFLAINFIFFVLPLYLLILFSLIGFIATFAAWAGIYKFVASPYENAVTGTVE